jgi:hypothetical protein
MLQKNSLLHFFAPFFCTQITSRSTVMIHTPVTNVDVRAAVVQPVFAFYHFAILIVSWVARFSFAVSASFAIFARVVHGKGILSESVRRRTRGLGLRGARRVIFYIKTRKKNTQMFPNFFISTRWVIYIQSHPTIK